MSLLRFCLAALCAGLAASVASAAELKPDPPKNCRSCAEWNQPAEPYPLFGNTWYVGSAGLSSVLITSDQGHILIDGGLAETAPLIAANIVKLGFRLEDVKIIATSHGHYDHIGGVAALARASGARVIASPRTADFAFLARGMDELDAAARQGHGAATTAILHRLVPEFRDAGTSPDRALQQHSAE